MFLRPHRNSLEGQAVNDSLDIPSQAGGKDSIFILSIHEQSQQQDRLSKGDDTITNIMKSHRDSQPGHRDIGNPLLPMSGVYTVKGYDK